MTPHDSFVMLVQAQALHVLIERGGGMRGLRGRPLIQIVGEAMAVPDVAIPATNLSLAALEWFVWCIDPTEAKPQFLVEYEENLRNRVALEQLDACPSWWMNVERLLDGEESYPKSWREFATGRERIVVMSRQEADGFVEWAKTVHGWDEDDPPFKIHEQPKE